MPSSRNALSEVVRNPGGAKVGKQLLEMVGSLKTKEGYDRLTLMAAKGVRQLRRVWKNRWPAFRQLSGLNESIPVVPSPLRPDLVCSRSQIYRFRLFQIVVGLFECRQPKLLVDHTA